MKRRKSLKKKFVIALALVLVLMLVTAVPALAWGGESIDVSLELSEINIDSIPMTGDVVIVSGTVTITSVAECSGFLAVAGASSEASVSIDGSPVGSISESDIDAGWFNAEANANLIYPWEVYYSTQPLVEYTVTHSGFADAWWARLFPRAHYGSNSVFDSVSATFTGAEEIDTYRCGGVEGSQFLIVLFDDRYYEGVAWEDGQQSQTLGEPACVVGRDNGATYKLEIPEGTEVSLPSGFHASYLEMTSFGNFSPSQMDFSQPVTVSELVNEEWVEVASFTNIRGGVAQ